MTQSKYGPYIQTDIKANIKLPGFRGGEGPTIGQGLLVHPSGQATAINLDALLKRGDASQNLRLQAGDTLIVRGGRSLHGATLDSLGDHRLAMSLAVAGLIAEGETAIMNAEAYRESFPNFVDLMRSLIAD